MYFIMILAVSAFSRISIGEGSGKLKDLTKTNPYSK